MAVGIPYPKGELNGKQKKLLFCHSVNAPKHQAM